MQQANRRRRYRRATDRFHDLPRATRVHALDLAAKIMELDDAHQRILSDYVRSVENLERMVKMPPG
jgi:hypothetical protein